MCEWLTSGDWSDVQIVCGGRSFGAHRAVLASVSTFLRGLFLSRSLDEAPIFIILPDYDKEAMSSVLNYVYKGEVNIEKHKFQLFMDIIRAMKIYIDYQCLAESSQAEINSKIKSGAVVKNIYTLSSRNEKYENIFNIKKITEKQSLILQYQDTDTDLHDNNVRCQNESELGEARLGNLNSPYADRQRNSFLRDLFIETYPRNGNVNGRTEGVLAISNECYHSPTSVLSANANGKHLNVNDALPTMCNNSTNILPFPNVHLNRDKNTDVANFVNTNYKRHSTDTLVYCCRQTTVNFQKDICTSHLTSPEYLSSLRSMSSFRTISNINSFELSNYPMHSNELSKAQNIVKRNSRKEDKNKSAKVIFNQVLQNPWSSRKPNNYKPFRRKLHQDFSQDLKVDKTEQLNDSNNNIQAPPPCLVTKNTCDVIEEEEVPIEIELTSTADNFKCSFCNQVFTSGEVLEAHMRRHSTNARYTCGECGKTFSQLRNFKYHMSIHRGTREFAATCTVCGKYFNDRGYLSSHMKIHRNRKEYKCTQCPKSFNQRVAYNMHVRIHTGIKPHVCEECGKAFSRKMLLKQHQRTHSGERPYACPHCDKRFADRSNMTLHLRLHTGVKPFSCSLCPKSFTKKHHLKSHLNFHTGSKPYSCPRCNLSFTQSSNMRTHMKKCTASENKVDETQTSTI